MVTNEQLDECHGHTHPVMWDGKIKNIYHYHLNNEFPYAVGCFRGKVDYSKALGSADMKAHNKPHGTPGHNHNHNHNHNHEHGPHGRPTDPPIIIPRVPFQ
jgi:hypothetical protein